MPRVLVTGGTGFIGQRVVARFRSEGWDVASFALPNDPLPPGWQGCVEAIGGDITRPEEVRAACRGAALAIHLAALVGHAGDYDRQWQVIAEGTRHLCTAMAEQGGRAVVISSIAVYGDRIQHQLCREDDGFGAWQGGYGRAKQGQETIAREIAARTGMPLTLLRPANVYGFGAGGAWGENLVALFRDTGGALFGDAAANNAGLVHVDNVADAIWLAATRPEAIGRIYNICDEEQVSWAHFFGDIAALAGRPSPPAFPLTDVLAEARANEDPARCQGPSDPALPSLEGLNLIAFDNRIDAARIRAELGWVPRRHYAEVMAEARQSFERGQG